MKQKILGFDGLRALAVLAVFIYHQMPRLVGKLGYVGVELFFALSGFLIISILYDSRLKIEANARTYKHVLKSFFARRFVRIFPIYYLTLATLALLAYFGIFTTDWDAQGHVFHALYLSNVWIGSIKQEWMGIYSHLWSLSVEAQFYFLAAPLLLMIPARLHLKTCACIVAFGLTIVVAKGMLGAEEISFLNNSFINFSSIALGGIAGLIDREKVWRTEKTLPLFMAVAALAAVWVLLFTAHGWMKIALNQLVPLIAACIVFLVRCNQSSAVIHFLEWKPIAHLGRISYGFYLYHNFLSFTILDDTGIINKVSNHVFQLLLAGVAAEISWRFIERPIMSWGHKADT